MLTDYMMINMMHLLITNSTKELLQGMKAHLDFIPPDSKLEALEIDTTLEEERPEGAPEVNNDRNFRIHGCLTVFVIFSFRSLLWTSCCERTLCFWILLMR